MTYQFQVVMIVFQIFFHDVSLAAEESFVLMSFNVQNLFDSQNDLGKLDEEYLPLSIKQQGEHRRYCQKNYRFSVRKCQKLNWSGLAVRLKIRALVEIISDEDPDIIVLQEVENNRILKNLTDSLSEQTGKNYQGHLVEGNDRRGIDVAVVSHYPVVLPLKTYFLKYQKRSLSRPILEVQLRISKATTVSVLGVHLPSQMRKFSVRQQAVEQIIKLVSRRADVKSIVLAGDFNISQSESRQLFQNTLAKHFTVSHLVGCSECKGTYYYAQEDQWSFFDAILIPRNSNWSFRLSSIHVVSHPRYTEAKSSRPRPYKAGKLGGASDHLPIVARLIRFRNK